MLQKKFLVIFRKFLFPPFLILFNYRRRCSRIIYLFFLFLLLFFLYLLLSNLQYWLNNWFNNWFYDWFLMLVYKIQQLLHSLIASLMWSFHCVDLVCWLVRLLVGGKPSRPFHATQYVILTYTFMLLLQ
jgi:hypothetical protein